MKRKAGQHLSQLETRYTSKRRATSNHSFRSNSPRPFDHTDVSLGVGLDRPDSLDGASFLTTDNVTVVDTEDGDQVYLANSGDRNPDDSLKVCS